MPYFVSEVSSKGIFIRRPLVMLHARADIDVFTIRHNAVLRVRGF